MLNCFSEKIGTCWSLSVKLISETKR